MGFRFRKIVPLLPWLRLNVSKSGVSASIGPHGADLNIGPNGVRGTVGIPGTGLSYSQRLDRGATGPAAAAAPPSRSGPGWPLIKLLALLFLLFLLARILTP